MIKCYRLNSIFSFKREPYRDAFLFEKAIKTDIYAGRFALLNFLAEKRYDIVNKIGNPLLL